MRQVTNVSIYGLGNFGYALLKHFDAKRGATIRVTAYDRNPDLMQRLRDDHRHTTFHQSVTLTDYVGFADTAEQLLARCDVLILAVPSDATREVLSGIRGLLPDKLILVNTAKALDRETGQRLSVIAEQELPAGGYVYSLLAGGTIASDLFRHEPLGVDIACHDERAAALLVDLFSTDALSVYHTRDLLGVEYAGAFKNVVAILAGLINGFGLSYGAETHMISRIAGELGDTCVRELDAMPETFSIGSQCWGNDLWMSCTGNTRNRELGVLIGKGMSPKNAVEMMAAGQKTVEGLNTLRVLDRLPAITQIRAVRLLYELIIAQSIDARDAKQQLVSNYSRGA